MPDAAQLEQLISHSETETYEFGKTLARVYGNPGTVFAFSGDLGTGKTVIIRGICAYFGCEEQVTSPTFTLVNEYSGSAEIIHCDLYRLETIEQILEIGLDDLMKQERLVLIEWAEKALPVLPLARLEVVASHTDDDSTRMYRWQYRSDETAPTLIRETEIRSRNQ